MDLRDKILFKPPGIGCVLSLTGLPGGGSKIYDRSHYGNVGTIVGAAWQRLPSGLWCLNFDGNDDYVDCGNAASLTNISGQLTFMAWIKASTSWINYKSLVGKWESGDLAWIVHQCNGGLLRFAVSADGTTNNWSRWDTPTGEFALDTYYQIAVTFLAGEGYVYKNGTDLGITPVVVGTVDHIHTASSATKIGSHQTCYFKGVIALPRVYNRALSALEIQNHFNDEKHLFGVW